MGKSQEILEMLKRLGLGKKIGAGFGLVLVMLCVVGTVGYRSMHAATESIDGIVTQLDIAKEVNTVLTDAQDAQAGALRYIIYDDDKYYREIEAETTATTEHATSAKGMMKSAENQAMADEVLDQIAKYVSANKAWRDLQVQRRECGQARAQAAGVVLDNIKGLLDAQHAAINAAAQDGADGKVTDYAVVERTLRAQEVRNAFNRVRIWAQKYQLAVTPEKQDEIAHQWVDEIGVTRGVLQECQQAMQDPTALQCLSNSLAALDDYAAQVEAFRQINRSQRAVQFEQQKPAADALMAASRNVRDGVYDYIDDVRTQSQTRLNTSNMLITGIALGAVIAGVLCALLITRSIVKPINRIIGGLTSGADQVNDAATQVSSASQQLAEGASEQASSLEETSSALEQMAAMTRTNAENAGQANNLAAQAREAANTGEQTMTKLNDAMAGINESSEQISKIIKVIEEIAFQTNLLALNAAVEAARAGEHGKGFAVVAEEVRNLAQRAADAARETTTLIEGAAGRSREGVTVAEEVGASLGRIVNDVAQVSELISGISQASNEQAQGVDQINTAVGQMDKVTQQNAANAEESASASEQLVAQSQAVKGIVDDLSALVSGGGATQSFNSLAPRLPQRRAQGGHDDHAKHSARNTTTPAPHTFAKTAPTDGDWDQADLQDF
jgi:methyl-accepting chemotaxis protein